MIRACLLALIAGYADTVGFLRFDAFGGLMTGNTILCGIEVAKGLWPRAGFHATIMVVFLAGVILAQVMLRLKIRVWVALCVSAVLLAVCGLFEKSVSALVLPLAMGVQNSAANRFNGVALNTVFITGNIQKVGEGMLAAIWPREDHRSDGFAIFGLVWIAYGVGAGLGAVAEQTMSQPLLLAAGLLPVVMLKT